MPFNFLWAIGMLVASYAIQVLLMPRPEKPKPASLEDFDFPQVEEGTPQSVIFGDVWISDWHVLWYGNLRTSAVQAESGKEVIIYMRHIRAAKICSGGARLWFSQNNLSWNDFLSNGIPVEQVEHLNDGIANRVIQIARQEAENGQQ